MGGDWGRREQLDDIDLGLLAGTTAFNVPAHKMSKSERQEQKAGGTSPDIDWRTVRTTGSVADEAASLVKREVSMRLTKRESGKRVTDELSSSLAGRRSGWWESVSGAERSFPGMWIILRSKSARSRSQ